MSKLVGRYDPSVADSRPGDSAGPAAERGSVLFGPEDADIADAEGFGIGGDGDDSPNEQLEDGLDAEELANWRGQGAAAAQTLEELSMDPDLLVLGEGASQIEGSEGARAGAPGNHEGSPGTDPSDDGDLYEPDSSLPTKNPPDR